MKNKKITRMVTTAVLLALATVLGMIKVWEMPLGGSVTLVSMLPVCLLAIKYDTRWGFISAFLFSLIQLGTSLGKVLSWGLSAEILIGCIVFDYILAYSVLGVSGIFKKKGSIGIIAGITLALILRFICHLISGIIFFGVLSGSTDGVVVYSILYNGSYMLPELGFTLIAAFALVKAPQTKKLLLTA